MASLHDHLRALSVEIGPRPSASPGEEAAAEYVRRELRGQGLECHRRRFQAASPAEAGLVIYALVALAALLYPRSPAAGFLLSLSAAFIYVLESSTYRLVSRLLPGRRSVNVLAKIHARSKEQRRVLVLAHLDSPCSRTGFLPQGQGHWAVLTAMLGSALIYGAGLAAAANMRAILWYVSVPFALGIPPAALLLFQSRKRKGDDRTAPLTSAGDGVPAPGGNDNAAGVAVLLETAKVLGRAPLLTTSVWCVATGAGEAGHRGALDLIREHRFAPDKTLVINVDAPGAGRLAVLAREGVFLPLGASPILLEAAAATAKEKAIDLELFPRLLRSTDATAFLARRIPAVTITALDARRLPLAGRGEAGSAERVDPANLVRTKDLVLGILRKLEE